MPVIGSREYKMMLKASKFNGGADELNEAATALWQGVASVILPNTIAVSGTDDIARRRRQVSFYDTADHWLRQNDYVVRERRDVDSQERQLTLKFRHPDRFYSQDRVMEPADKFTKDLKFEEDIKPSFQSLYSYSSNVVLKEKMTIEKLEQVGEYYPGLEKAVKTFPREAKLTSVGDFTAFENVIKGTSFQIRKDPELLATCSLTLWYTDEADEKPLIAEFSFKYVDDKEDYSGKAAHRAYLSYLAMQEQLKSWIDSQSMTKTAYVYSLAK
jgi:hypothetical protein